MNEIMNISLSRRQFLGLSAAAGASVLLLGVTLPTGCAKIGQTEQDQDLNAFIGIDDKGQVVFQNPFIEMGQGTYTSIPAIMAEELDVEMSAIKVVQAPHGADYKIMFDNTMRFTGGSLSVRSSYMTMRKAGATARAMLVQAAAEQWGVKPGDCTTEPGKVVHAASGRKLGYGELAEKAAKLTPPKDAPLKDSAAFRLIGQPVKRTDSLAKSTGAAEFGIDIKVDGMLHAAVMQSPVFGGKVASYDKEAVLKLPGVVAVEEIPNGVAVIADHFWHAKKALEKLPVTFDEGANAGFSTKDYKARLQAALNEPGHVAEEAGDAAKAMASAAKTIEAEYHAPFIAHVTMEPMNCTALVTQDRCTVWAPNQGVDFVVGVAAEITGLKPEAIEVITPFLGGGFGRRFVMDYAIQAITLAKKTSGQADQGDLDARGRSSTRPLPADVGREVRRRLRQGRQSGRLADHLGRRRADDPPDAGLCQKFRSGHQRVRRHGRAALCDSEQAHECGQCAGQRGADRLLALGRPLAELFFQGIVLRRDGACSRSRSARIPPEIAGRAAALQKSPGDGRKPGRMEGKALGRYARPQAGDGLGAA